MSNLNEFCEIIIASFSIQETEGKSSHLLQRDLLVFPDADGHNIIKKNASSSVECDPF